MTPDKHECVNSYYVFKGVGCGFVVNRKMCMNGQKYVAIVVFLILS